MGKGLRSVAVATALAGALGACNGFSYISGIYVTLPAQVVTIGCNDPYEVYDKREASRMLLVSNALREYAGCGIEQPGDPAASRRARFREAADTFLRESFREECQVTGETVFGDLQTEFTYRCTGPAPKPGDRVVRLPGRR